MKKLSRLYRETLEKPENLGQGLLLERVYRFLVNCEGAGVVEGASRMLEAVAPFLAPAELEIGKKFCLQLKAESDAEFRGDATGRRA